MSNSILFCFIFLLSFSNSQQWWETGNGQLTRAINKGMKQCWNSEISNIFANWFYYPFVIVPPTCLDPESYVAPDKAVGTMKRILDRGVINVASYLQQPITYYVNGTLVGSEVDVFKCIMKKISDYYGKTISINWVFPVVDTNFFFNLTSFLQNGSADAVTANMAMRSWRREFVNFTCSYAPASGNSILRSGLEPNLTAITPYDFNNPRFKIAVTLGTYYEQLFDLFFPNATKVPASNEEQWALAENYTVHALIDDSLVIGYNLVTHQCVGCYTLNTYRFALYSNTSNSEELAGIATRIGEDPEIPIYEPSKLAIALGLALGIVTALLLAIVVFIIYRKAVIQKYTFALNPPLNLPQLTTVTIVENIGSGNFGEVFLGDWNGTPVALKTLNSSDHLCQEMYEELAILKKLNHPNIVQLLGEYTDGMGKQYIVFEYMKSGSLLSQIQQRSSPMSTKKIVRIVVSICKAMAYLEDRKIVHRDLALRNILVDEHSRIKVGDFGLARAYTTAYEATSSSIPIRWSAPELFKQGRATSKSDVFSFAVVIWELFSNGRFPWIESSNEEVVKRVLAGERLSRPEACPKSIFKLMRKCWQHNPEDRPSFAEILNKLHELFPETEEIVSPSSRRNSISNERLSSSSPAAITLMGDYISSREEISTLRSSDLPPYNVKPSNYTPTPV